MGRDKATLVVDGRMMAVRAADALRQAGAVDVFAVGGPAEALAEAGLIVVPDTAPGTGPVQAIVTALRVAEAPVVLVVSCDLLDPSPAAMAATVRALDGAGDTAGPGAGVDADTGGAAVAVPLDAEGRWQWMHGAWRRDGALAVLEAAVGRGERALWRAARGLRVVEVAGLDPAALRDADRPADLAPHRRRPGPGPTEG